MSTISNGYLKNFNEERYNQLTIYNKKMEKFTEKLELKEKEILKLKSENDKLISDNSILSEKLDIAEDRIKYLKSFDDELLNKIRCLTEELKREQDLRKSLEFQKQLDQNNKRTEQLLKETVSTADSKAYGLPEKKSPIKEFKQRNGSLPMILEKTGNRSQSGNSKRVSLQPIESQLFSSERRTSLQGDFLDVINNARLKKKADFVNRTPNVEQEFADFIINLAIETVAKEFNSYSELSDYMRDKIREKYNQYYLVIIGKFNCYNSSSWSFDSRKTLSFKISNLGFAIFQIHTECLDLINTAKWVTNIEIVSKNQFIDEEFEKSVTSLALETIGKNLTDYQQMSEFMSTSIARRFGKKWFVVVGVYDSYDLCLNVSLCNKRKFIELLIKDLRFTIFQAI